MTEPPFLSPLSDAPKGSGSTADVTQYEYEYKADLATTIRKFEEFFEKEKIQYWIARLPHLPTATIFLSTTSYYHLHYFDTLEKTVVLHRK